MRHHLQNLTLCDPEHPLHGRNVNLIVEQGIISEISDAPLKSSPDDENFDGDGAWLIPGLMDTGTWIGDPGFEPMEDLESAAQAALAGGFTDIAVLPETEPVIQGKSAVEYYLKRSQHLPVEFYPIAALTEKLKGENLSELYDMKTSGAIAFTNAWRPLAGYGVLLRALQYTQPFGGLVVYFPDEKTISEGGQMNECEESVLLGMKGIPAMAEEMALKNALDVAEFCKARIHISRISTTGSVRLIKEAKKRGVRVTCDVAVMNIVGTDTLLADYDTNLKLMPPLRSMSDVEALKAGLLDNTIDAISSDHCPKDPEHKVLEFDYAAFGALGLQTFLPLLLQAFGENALKENLSRWCSRNPRKVFGLPEPRIEKGAQACFTLFNPITEWIFNDTTNRSKSANSVYFGKKLKGQIVATYHKQMLHTF